MLLLLMQACSCWHLYVAPGSGLMWRLVHPLLLLLLQLLPLCLSVQQLIRRVQLAGGVLQVLVRLAGGRPS